MSDLKHGPWATPDGSPHNSSAISMDRHTVEDITLRLVAGRKKFAGSRFLYAALIEEVGELGEAILSGDAKQVRDEAIDVACVAIRIVEEGEVTKYQYGRLISLAVSVGNVARHLLQKTPGPWAAMAATVASRMDREGDQTFDNMTDQESQA
jgi:hypothetical protein